MIKLLFVFLFFNCIASDIGDEVCFETTDSVQIIPDSRYGGQASGSCGTVESRVCEGNGYNRITFENSWTNTYEYEDLRYCPYAGTKPTTSPTTPVPTVSPTVDPTSSPITADLLCFFTTESVQIIPDSRYAGQASGHCGTVETRICQGNGHKLITFENGYSNNYAYEDLQYCPYAGTKPTSSPTATVPTVSPTNNPTTSPTMDPTAPPTTTEQGEIGCFETTDSVQILPGSRYGGQASGYCGTTEARICPGNGYTSVNFENSYTNSFEYEDLRYCPGVQPSVQPSAQPTVEPASVSETSVDSDMDSDDYESSYYDSFDESDETIVDDPTVNLTIHPSVAPTAAAETLTEGDEENGWEFFVGAFVLVALISVACFYGGFGSWVMSWCFAAEVPGKRMPTGKNCDLEMQNVIIKSPSRMPTEGDIDTNYLDIHKRMVE